MSAFTVKSLISVLIIFNLKALSHVLQLKWCTAVFKLVGKFNQHLFRESYFY